MLKEFLLLCYLVHLLKKLRRLLVHRCRCLNMILVVKYQPTIGACSFVRYEKTSYQWRKMRIEVEIRTHYSLSVGITMQA